MSAVKNTALYFNRYIEYMHFAVERQRCYWRSFGNAAALWYVLNFKPERIKMLAISLPLYQSYLEFWTWWFNRAQPYSIAFRWPPKMNSNIGLFSLCSQKNMPTHKRQIPLKAAGIRTEQKGGFRWGRHRVTNNKIAGNEIPLFVVENAFPKAEF